MFDPERIRTLMKQKNLNLMELSTEAKLSHTALSSIINGESDPKVGTLERIAKALRIPTSYLLGEDSKDFDPEYIFYLPKSDVTDKSEITVVIKLK